MEYVISIFRTALSVKPLIGFGIKATPNLHIKSIFSFGGRKRNTFGAQMATITAAAEQKVATKDTRHGEGVGPMSRWANNTASQKIEPP